MYKHIKLISFDVNKTLIKVSGDVCATYLKTAQSFGIEKNCEIISEKFNKTFLDNFKKLDKELPNYGKASNMSSSEWWSRLVINIFNDIGYTNPADQPKLKSTADHLYVLYSRGSGWQVKPGAVDLLNELRKQKPNVSLAVVSNFDGRLETILRDLNLRPNFSHLFASSQVGIAKPDPKIFEYVLKTCNVDANDYLHIGDDVEKDYLPVKSIGGNAIIVHDDSNDAALANVDKAHIVPNLISLKELLFDNKSDSK